jgi:hypothetical protein
MRVPAKVRAIIKEIQASGVTRTAAGEALAISVPAGETRVLKHFQKRMPYGLFVPDAP